jgi:acetyl esterase
MPLDAEVAALLERQKNLPPRSSLDAAATREMMRRAGALAGDPPPVAFVEELTLAEGLHARQYWPSEAAGLPLVVYFHGGRFFSGDLESHDTLCRLLAIAAGSRVLAVDYRLAPEFRFPTAADDALTALDWALTQRVPVAVAGDSSGANLAAGAAQARRGSPLRCQLLVYPMIDATGSSASYAEFAEGYGPGAGDMLRGWSEYLPEGTDPRDPRVSPVFAKDLAGSAPAFVLTAEYDTLRDEGETYARKLLEAGCLVQARRYQGMIHGFFAMTGILQGGRIAMRDAVGFLRRHLPGCGVK